MLRNVHRPSVDMHLKLTRELASLGSAPSISPILKHLAIEEYAAAQSLVALPQSVAPAAQSVAQRG